jgi:hypothetical protein
LQIVLCSYSTTKPLKQDKKNRIISLCDKGLLLLQIAEKCGISHMIVARKKEAMAVHRFVPESPGSPRLISDRAREIAQRIWSKSQKTSKTVT